MLNRLLMLVFSTQFPNVVSISEQSERKWLIPTHVKDDATLWKLTLSELLVLLLPSLLTIRLFFGLESQP